MIIFIYSESISRIKNSKYPVNFSDFSLNASIPTSSNKSKEALIAAIDNIGGLDNCQPSAPAITSNGCRILNRVSLLWFHQPAKRGKSLFLECFSCTNNPAKLPGPEFKYL